jgi:hypothetical protein
VREHKRVRALRALQVACCKERCSFPNCDANTAQMTYHHFVNVAALAFAPYWIFYKARISAQRETKCILVGAGFYVMAQFLELITLATFVSGGGERQPTEQAAGSLLHILQVNLRFSSSHRLPRDFVTSYLQSRLIGLIHVAGLVMALAMHSNNPRTQVALASLFCL